MYSAETHFLAIVSSHSFDNMLVAYKPSYELIFNGEKDLTLILPITTIVVCFVIYLWF